MCTMAASLSVYEIIQKVIIDFVGQLPTDQVKLTRFY